MKDNKLYGLIAATWAIAGVSLLLLNAIFRLSNIAWELTDYSLSWYHWVILGLNLIFMAYSEGYKGFQLKFAPRFAARCLYLRRNPRPLHALLAPLFCMGFFHTTRKRKVITFTITLTIIGFIQIAHLLQQPWRGILDAGVVLGLTWGLLSTYYYLQKAFNDNNFDHTPELPAGYR